MSVIYQNIVASRAYENVPKIKRLNKYNGGAYETAYLPDLRGI